LRHEKISEDQLHAILLARGLIARRKQNWVVVDLRSVLPEQDHLVRNAVIPEELIKSK